MKNKRILIANRGEIALRIIRSAKELGLKTIAVYSDIDKESLHVKKADESIHLGPSLPAESYRNLKIIVEASFVTNGDFGVYLNCEEFNFDEGDCEVIPGE